MKTYKNEVSTAFEILLEEIENVVEALNQEAERIFKCQDYEKAKILIEDASKITNFREKIKELQQQWKDIFAAKASKEWHISISKKKEKSHKKLKEGLRTPEDAYRIPILESIVELGGEGKAQDVMDKVFEKMAKNLNEYDLAPLPLNPRIKRWKNTTRWCRYTLTNEGLIDPNSERGVWVITEKGRNYLKSNI